MVNSARPRTPRSLHLIGLVALLAFGSSCRIKMQENDWEAYDGPGAAEFRAEEMEFAWDLMKDPLEPINRPISTFNYALIYGIVQPVAWVYRHIMPKPARKSVGRVFDNALYPGRVVNNLLQGKWGGAKRETQRFLINTTVGVAGLFDPAKSKWEIKPSKEDLGQTLHKWGWKYSSYFVIPVLGPSTIRDGVGLVGDNYLDPLTYIDQPTGDYIKLYRVFNRLSDLVPGIVEFVERNYDPYQLSKLLFILNREVQTEDYSYKSEDTGDTETLESIFFRPQDPNFDEQGETHTIDLPNGKNVTYTAWIHDEPAPVLFYVPGTGGHRVASSALAIAEGSYNNGRSVVSISSALNPEFIENTLSNSVPGFMPSDAADAHLAFDAIYWDLVKRYSADHFGKLIMGGLSLGAMTTLYVAAANTDPTNELIDFDLYFPVDCPISLGHAVRTLDGFFNAPLQFPLEERQQKVRGLFRKVLDLGTSGDLTPTEPMPFVDWEAKFLIGFAFRLTTIATIQQTQEKDDLGVLKTKRTWFRRSMSYMECSRFSFIEYMYAFLLPYVAGQRDDIDFTEAGAERLLYLCDIRSLEEQLVGREDIEYFSNRNDPLLRAEDITWVEQTLGDNAHFFPTGGHLGNMTHQDVRDAFRAAADEHLQN